MRSLANYDFFLMPKPFKGRCQKKPNLFGTLSQTMDRWGSQVPNFLVKKIGLGVAVGGWGSRVPNKYMELCPKNFSFFQKDKML